MNDMVSMRKMRFSADGAGEDAVVAAGCGDFVLEGKEVV
jgi:hypothetical protein